MGRRLKRQRFDVDGAVLQIIWDVILKRGANKVLLWSTISRLPAIRRLLPEHHITFAQRHPRPRTVIRSPASDDLESAFKKLVGTHHALTMNSGTATLHSAFFSAGVKPGSEVIVPSYTRYASAAPILPCGGRPVFCDIDEDTLTAASADAEKRITPATRVLCAIHPVMTYTDAVRGGLLEYLFKYYPGHAGGWNREATVRAARLEGAPISPDRYTHQHPRHALLHQISLFHDIGFFRLAGHLEEDSPENLPKPRLTSMPVTEALASRLITMEPLTLVRPERARAVALALRKVADAAAAGCIFQQNDRDAA